MIDFLDQEVKVGDQVAYIDPKHRRFNSGTIVKINEKTITILYKTKYWEYKTVRKQEHFIKINKD
jgi:hypothetical protein